MLIHHALIDSRPGRALAALLAALALASPLLASAHEAAVRHGVCPEHGDVIEARGPAHVEPPDSESGSFSGDAAATLGEHDRHCAIALQARQRSTAAARAVQAPARII